MKTNCFIIILMFWMQNMKHIIFIFIACILFPLTIQAQMRTVMYMRHADDNLDVKYTKDMLQGKLWELEIQEGVEGVHCGCLEFNGNSMHQTYIVGGTKYEFPCIYYLSDSFEMDFDDNREGSNQAGKYLQVKYLDANCDGTGNIGFHSFWIRKLTDDTLELTEWRAQDATIRFHAKQIK